MPPEDQFQAQEKSLIKIVLRAYKNPFTIQSNYARKHADYIGIAASMGLITTRWWGNTFSREWRPTVKGLGYLSVHLGDEFARSITMQWGHSDG